MMNYKILSKEDFDDIEIQDTDMDIIYAIADELIANEIYNTHYLSNIPLLESRALKFKRIINEL